MRPANILPFPNVTSKRPRDKLRQRKKSRLQGLDVHMLFSVTKYSQDHSSLTGDGGPFPGPKSLAETLQAIPGTLSLIPRNTRPLLGAFGSQDSPKAWLYNVSY